ncbi:MAG TPA: NfeD family protein [Acidimicrobiales bacterium]|nr:NfeD family protein [Acidimicrobiales bacterium]
MLLASSASAQAKGEVDVIEVNGLIDRVVADFVTDAVDDAERSGVEALVVQLDSSGAVVDDARLDALVARIEGAAVPVAVWVGPTGAKAKGDAVRLVQAARLRGIAPGARIEDAPDEVLQAPTLGDFIVDLDGRTYAGSALETSEVVQEPGKDPRRTPTVNVRFQKLGLVARLLHTAASPSVAYVMFVLGLALIVFELYTAGIGVAAVTGACALVLGGFGLAELPTRPWALALLALGVFGYAVDVQAGSPRAWTVIGTVSLAVGTVRLYDGYSPSLLVMLFVVAGTALFMVAGMPSMVRARFSTPTIGRESMVGDVGEALVAVDPDGTVEVRGAPWRARTNRATPIAPGEAVRVVGIDGLLLEVEPEAGGAKDYRRH